jgi:pyruvate/oxaloacetate carboxyltransferase
LGEFYELEKKRVIVEFEEMMEGLFGKAPEAVEKKLTPNFVISGTKLVFLPPMPSADLSSSSGKGKKA